MVRRGRNSSVYKGRHSAGGSPVVVREMSGTRRSHNHVTF